MIKRFCVNELTSLWDTVNGSGDDNIMWSNELWVKAREGRLSMLMVFLRHKHKDTWSIPLWSQEMIHDIGIVTAAHANVW